VHGSKADAVGCLSALECDDTLHSRPCARALDRRRSRRRARPVPGPGRRLAEARQRRPRRRGRCDL